MTICFTLYFADILHGVKNVPEEVGLKCWRSGYVLVSLYIRRYLIEQIHGLTLIPSRC